MQTKVTNPFILAGVVVVAFFNLFPSVHADPHVGLMIEINSPPPHDHHFEHRWDSPGHGAIWIAGHYEWVRDHWVWIDAYYTYPPTPGYVWTPGHYVNEHDNHYWVAGYWAAPAPAVVIQPASVATPQAAPATAPQPPPPYGGRLGNTNQIQSPYSQNIITSNAARDTVVYDPSTGQPFRVP